jgi:hypothetical protein
MINGSMYGNPTGTLPSNRSQEVVYKRKNYERYLKKGTDMKIFVTPNNFSLFKSILLYLSKVVNPRPTQHSIKA